MLRVLTVCFIIQRKTSQEHWQWLSMWRIDLGRCISWSRAASRFREESPINCSEFTKRTRGTVNTRNWLVFTWTGAPYTFHRRYFDRNTAERCSFLFLERRGCRRRSAAIIEINTTLKGSLRRMGFDLTDYSGLIFNYFDRRKFVLSRVPSRHLKRPNSWKLRIFIFEKTDGN